MELPEPHTHSFVVKIWLEEAATDGHGGAWRGHVTHVPSGERHYFETLTEIADFVMPFLQEMGIRPGVRWRIRLWLRQKSWWPAPQRGW
jgi:hypothetical protein